MKYIEFLSPTLPVTHLMKYIDAVKPTQFRLQNFRRREYVSFFTPGNIKNKVSVLASIHSILNDTYSVQAPEFLSKIIAIYTSSLNSSISSDFSNIITFIFNHLDSYFHPLLFGSRYFFAFANFLVKL